MLVTAVVAGLGTMSGSAFAGGDQPVYPEAPTDLHITDSSRQTSLTAAWTAVSGASAYRIGRNGVALTDTTQTSYTWTGLTCGTRYTLSIQPEAAARDSRGQLATVSGTTASCSTSPATGGAQSSSTAGNETVSQGARQTYPQAPTDLRITDSSRQTSLTAAWTAVSGASAYRIGRNGVALTDTTQTSYTWTGLTCGTRYTLSIQPEAAARDSRGQLATVSGTTASCSTSPATGGAQSSSTAGNETVSQGARQTYPQAPTDLRITDSSRQTSLTAAWTAVSGASAYRIGRNGVALTDTTQTSYTWTGLTCGTRYTLSIQPEAAARDTRGQLATVSGTTASCSSSADESTSGGDRSGGSVVFKGSFANGTISQWQSTHWGGAQCENYGVKGGSNHVRGNLHVVDDPAGTGRHSGRFDLPASGASNACELLRGRTIGMDDEWYSMEVRFPGDWREPSSVNWGMSLAQFNFEGIWGSPVGLVAHANHVDLTLNAGLCTALSQGNPSCQYSSGIGGNVPSQSIVSSSDFSTGVWHQLLIHVRWTNGDNGVVEGYHRLRGQRAWTRTLRFSGYPTLQRTSTFTPTAIDPTTDKIGAYRGAAGFPLSIWQGNFCQATSMVAAETCF